MLHDNYRYLYQFFTGYFPEADLDGLTDKQVVQLFIKENEETIIASTYKELKQVINDKAVWSEIAEAANRYFESESALHTWLVIIAKQFTI